MKKSFVFIFFVGLPGSVFAMVGQCNFITAPQTIEKNNPSRPFILEIEDVSGNKQKAGETFDIELHSSSLSGVFLADPVAAKTITTLVMSSNFSKRTFYYRDSNTGQYVISARVKGRKTNREWVIWQDVNIINPEQVTPRYSGFPIDLPLPEKISVSNKDKKSPPKINVTSTPIISTALEKPVSKPSFFLSIWLFIKSLFF